MIIIYSALRTGGSETFFIRLAKERKQAGLHTKILLIYPERRSERKLISEATAFADIIYLTDILQNKGAAQIAAKFPLASLLFSLNKIKTIQALQGDFDFHVADGFSAHIVKKISSTLQQPVRLTVGFYHSLEFCWGPNKPPLFERMNRSLVFDELESKNIIFFNKSSADINSKKMQKNLSGANIFPIGVIEEAIPQAKELCIREHSTYFKICSIGRLVDFKTYNLWMIDVVFRLKKIGLNIIYDIYGDGNLKELMLEKIQALGLTENIFLKGTIDYSAIPKTILNYDCFVGSGTTIIQSSSLGIPSIVGIESSTEPYSYGFFSDIQGYDYNEDGLFTKLPVFDLIHALQRSNEVERNNLSIKHIEKSNTFSMKACSINFIDCFSRITPKILKPAKINCLIYTVSLFISMIASKISNGRGYYSRYKSDSAQA